MVLYHALYERGGAAAVDALPGGRGWRDAVEAYPIDERHLVVHQGHAMQPNAIDERFLGEFLKFANQMALTGTAQQVSDKIAGLAALGVTELVYQPAGSDIERELRAFAGAAGLSS